MKPILATPAPKDIRIHAWQKEGWTIRQRIHPGLVRGYGVSDETLTPFTPISF